MSRVLPPLLVALALPGCEPVEPTAAVRELFAALNDHDVDRALASLHDEYVFRDAAGTFEIPRESMRPLLEWDAATRSRSEATIREVRGDTVVVKLEETNDFLERLGVAPWRHDAKLVVREGKIVATILDDPGALGRRVDRALAPVLAWARETRPGRLEGLVTEHGLVYDGDTARRWLALLREARAAGVIGSGAGTGP